MTDEEKLAKAYALEVVQLEYEDFIQHQGSVPMETIIERVAYQAYLSGLKAGKDMAETDLATIAYMQGAEYGYNKCNAKLTKAKEILRKFLDAKSIEETCVAESEAEQFLRNLER